MVLTNGGCVHCAEARANGEEWCPDCDADLRPGRDGDDADGDGIGGAGLPASADGVRRFA